MTKAAAILAILFTFAPGLCCAGELPLGLDAYAGVAGGYGGETHAAPADSPIRDPYALDDWFYGGYAGLGWRMLAVEAGYWRLPHEHEYAEAPNPTRQAWGTIRGHAFYARAVLRAPVAWTLRPYLFAGAARVTGERHEIDNCTQCGAGFVPDFRETLTAIRPYLGAGIEVNLAGPLAARAEFGYIQRAFQDEHTARRDLFLGSLGLQLRF